MNIQDLDLNLLRVFNAIYAEKSISGAAQKLGLSQPAVSNALKRLRAYTGDPLFYRSGKGVTPTRTAVTLSVPVGYALDTLQRGLSSVRSFDPRTSDRTFRIGVNDIINSTLVPTMAQIVRQEAPNVKLQFITQTGVDLANMLKQGAFDIGLIGDFQLTDDLISQKVLEDPFTIIVSRNNPIARMNKLTIETLKEMNFVVTSHVPRMRSFIDDFFQAHGVNRNVTMAVADVQTLYPLVAITDLSACVGRHVAERYNVDGSLVMLDTPFDLPVLAGHVAWTAENDRDQGHEWVRNHMIEILQSAFNMHDPR